VANSRLSTLGSWPNTCEVKASLLRHLAGDVMELDMPNANMLAELITKSSSAHGRVASVVSVVVHHEPSSVASIEMSQRDQTEKDASLCQVSLLKNMAPARLKRRGE